MLPTGCETRFWLRQVRGDKREKTGARAPATTLRKSHMRANRFYGNKLFSRLRRRENSRPFGVCLFNLRNGPVSRVLYPLTGATVISLGRRLPAASSDLPGTGSDAGHISSPIWSCSGWGLQCPGRCRPGGGLLPRHFTLTAAGRPAEAVYFLLHFP